MSTTTKRALESAAPSGASSSLAVQAEDHALVPVPEHDRRTGWQLAINPAGLATGLVIFAVAGFGVLQSGFAMAMVAGTVVAAIGVLLSYFLGNVARVTGLSSTLTSRVFGLGVRGSATGALIFAFMIIGFLALENALLYEGTLLMFGWADNWASRMGIYGVLTLFWILLAVFGLRIVALSSTVMTIATLAVTAYLLYEIYIVRGQDPMAVFNSMGTLDGNNWSKLEASVALMGATAGTIALVITDFCRFTRTHKDVAILAVVGPVMQNMVMIVLGALVVVGGMPTVIDYLTARDSGLSPLDAAQSANAFAMGNTGAFFVVIGGWVGFVAMYATQAKAQAMNSYSGSLALSNLIEAVTGRAPARVLMVILGNGIAMAMVAGGILGAFSSWLGYLGCMTYALCCVMIADYYFIHRGRKVFEGVKVEDFNWAGICTVIISVTVGSVLIATNTMPLGFLVTAGLALTLYPLLRRFMPEGTGSGYVDISSAVDDAG